MTTGSTTWVGDEPLARRPEGRDEPLARRPEGRDEPLARRPEGRDEPARHTPFVAARCYEQPMSSECRACATGLQHCHGTVIHHAQHRSECTHDDCETPEVAHGFAVDCAA